MLKASCGYNHMLLTYQSKFRINDTINNDTFVSFLDM
jgi:hypothetical protein